jgi:pimeloyl-ACP methyl ester carboxylesterase
LTVGRATLPFDPFVDGAVTLPDGRDLAYAEFGARDGMPVFWFHGTPGSRTQLPPSTHPEAAERGIRVIGVDRPGFGRSSRHSTRTLRDWPRDVEYLADALRLEEFGVVGLSGGGPYVLACAHDLPDRISVGISLGGLGPIAGSDSPSGFPRIVTEGTRVVPYIRAPAGYVLTAFVKMLAPYVYGAVDAYKRVCPQTDRHVFDLPGFRDMFAASILHGVEHGLHGITEDMSVFSQPWGFDPSDITRVPIRFWHGTKDAIVPVAHGHWLAERVPNSRLTLQEGEGHFAGFVCVQAVLDAVLDEMTQSAVRTDAEA